MGEKRNLTKTYALIIVSFAVLVGFLDCGMGTEGPSANESSAVGLGASDSKERNGSAEAQDKTADVPVGRESPDDERGGILLLLGDDQHGKDVLLAAISKTVKNGDVTYKTVNWDEGPGTQGITVKTAGVEIQTEQRQYVVTDFASHADFLKWLLTGTDTPGGGIVVVNTGQGLMPDTRKAIILAESLGIPIMAVFFDGVDTTSDVDITTVELETSEILEYHGFPKTELPVVRGSASMALRGEAKGEEKIGALVTIIKAYSPPTRVDTAKPQTEFVSEVYLYRTEEGGLSAPLSEGHRTQFDWGTKTVAGSLMLSGFTSVAPGQHFQLQVHLDAPVKVKGGTRFSIREDNRIVGRGVVSTVTK